MRGAGETVVNTSWSFAPNGFLVGCNGVAHVIVREYSKDTYGGMQCELYMNKGGNTR